MHEQQSGSLTAPRLGRAIDPCNLAVDSVLELSDARVHESLGRINKGLHDLPPVGLAPVAEKSISGSAGGHSSANRKLLTIFRSLLRLDPSDSETPCNPL